MKMLFKNKFFLIVLVCMISLFLISGIQMLFAKGSASTSEYFRAFNKDSEEIEDVINTN